MDRRTLIRTLVASRFDKGLAVAYPDHPLLARGPDLLGKDARGLAAYFVHTPASGRPYSKREIARVLLSRLALPHGTRFVLIWAASNVPALRETTLFDELHILSDRGDTLSIDELSHEASELTEQLRPFHFARFAQAWAPAKHSPSAAFKYGRSTFAHKRDEVGRLPPWAVVESDHIVARLDARERRSPLLPEIQTLSVATTFVDYDLRNGLDGVRNTAYMLEHRDSHLAMHAMTLNPAGLQFDRTTDPHKVYRAAAFAGAQVDYPEAS